MSTLSSVKPGQSGRPVTGALRLPTNFDVERVREDFPVLKQTNKNLVLSDDAVINTKPELQILADDVRCTHGATIGQLDAEALFYMQSRGIGRRQARDLLTYAFAQDIIDRVKIPALKDQLEKVLLEKFHEHAE